MSGGAYSRWFMIGMLSRKGESEQKIRKKGEENNVIVWGGALCLIGEKC